jgi:TRAP-type uncharacterized transport system fused permease subunit
MGPFAAAAIAQADPIKTGWACFRFAKIIYVMPLLFAYTQILLTGTPTENIGAIASATLGTVLFSIMSTGCFYLRTKFREWILLAIATVLAFIPTIATGIAALTLFAALFMWQRRRAAVLMVTNPQIEIAAK